MVGGKGGLTNEIAVVTKKKMSFRNVIDLQYNLIHACRPVLAFSEVGL